MCHAELAVHQLFHPNHCPHLSQSRSMAPFSLGGPSDSTMWRMRHVVYVVYVAYAAYTAYGLHSSCGGVHVSQKDTPPPVAAAASATLSPTSECGSLFMNISEHAESPSRRIGNTAILPSFAIPTYSNALH